MEAAQPLHKGSSNPHGPGKKQKPEKPVVVPLPVTEVANLQTHKPESTAVTAGSANPYSNRMNLNGTIAPVHGSRIIYDKGAEIRYGKLQESLAETGDLNHPETKKLEKSYISTLSISQIRDYHNLKNGTYLPKTLEEQAAAYQAGKRTSDTNTPAKPLEKRETAGKTVMILSDQPQPVDPDKIAAEDIEAAPPANANGNPAFTELSGKISSTAKLQKQHESSQKATDAAQAAAPSPSNERQSMAQASHVQTMDAQQPGVFSKDDFKALLTKKIEGIKLPKNEAEADEFEKHNNISEVNKTAVGDVKREKNAASHAIASTTAAQPNDAAQPVRAVAQMPTPNIGKAPAVPNAAKAMPVKRNPGSVERPVQEQTASIDNEMKANGVTDNMLAKSNEPSFTGALAEKNKAKTQSAAATQQFRNKENQELSKTRDDAQAKASQHITGMHSARKGGLQNAHGEQKQTAGKDSRKRKEIADRINGIYQNSKKDVNGILNSLDKKVAEMFDAGSQKAKTAFEKHVDQGVKDYKKKRYGDAYADYGILYAAGKWLKDKITGLPPEVNKYFDSGKKLYITVMDSHIDRIATYVTTQLNAAKTRITTGKKDVQTYVNSLSPSLRKIGKEAIAEIQTKFSALEESINSKKEALIEVLAKKYADNIASIDTRIAELKTQNSGWVNQALNTLKTGVFAVIIEIKNTLAGLLSGVIDAIQAIITDPIGFFRNLIAGVSQGFTNFGANIWTHLKTGFFGWLTGAMKGISLTIPEDVFSLKGVFSITSQVLGLTWGGIRSIGARVIGEPVMKVLETASEKGLEVVQAVRKDGAAGLWEYLKDQFADLKTTVMDAIMDIIQSQVIQAGIKWVMGLLTPVGAFIKAAMAIIDVVKFFIQRAAQIMELVKAFTDSIKAIASGNVGAVAKSIENALGRAVPVLIGFLASLLGIGGLADKILGVIRKIRQRIENAIVKFWNFVKGKAGKMLSKIGVGKKENKMKSEKRTTAEMKKDLHDAVTVGTSLLRNKALSKEKIQDKLDDLKQIYDLKSLNLVTTKVKDRKEVDHIEGEVNPKEKGTDVEREAESKDLKYSIQKILFVNNESVDIENGKYPRDFEKQLSSIEGNLLKVKDKQSVGDEIRAIRRKWEIQKGVIYSPFVLDYQKALSDMNRDVNGTIITTETGGSFLGDVLVDTSNVKNHKIKKASKNHRQQQADDIVAYIKNYMGSNKSREEIFTIAEPMVSGSAIMSLFNKAVKPLIDSKEYPNIKFKFVMMQQEMGQDFEENEKKMIKARNNILKNYTIDDKADKIQLYFHRTKYILGEDVDAQTQEGYKEPIIIFKGTEQTLVAYKIIPTEETTTRDIAVAIAAGKFNGKLVNVL